MSPIAARKLASIVENLERVLAIELLTAFQAMEFLRPLASSKPIERVRRAFRRVVRPWTKDRVLSADLEKAHAFLDSDSVREAVASLK
jgi:histidine ammonia-lyase